MKSSEIREKFLKYFEGKEHKKLPGSSLVPSDPTVLLTLAGMLQFKPIFLGIEKPTYKRVATVQKCVRMSDIANVGKTSRHHTFFEMLGNFSFGDYFKNEAIAWAWELITKEFKIPKEKLLVAVYEKDDEAFDVWTNNIGVPRDKIFKLDEKNNFWAAGPTGPCGPCSEIYYDLGKEKGCGKPDCKPGCDCDRFLELWNLVFIEFNRDEKGDLLPLPSKNIDTGMGLERIASVLQGVPTNFDTDLFVPIIEKLREISSKYKPGEVEKEKKIKSERIISDHIRAITHMVADGLIPTNEGRGYVLRSLIRRAYSRGMVMGINEPYLNILCKTVIDVNGNAYPELKEQADFISQAIRTEEEHFSRTLKQGMRMINDLIKKSDSKGEKVISGKDIFVLHDTYGFPFDLTKEIAADRGIGVDEQGFIKEMEKQKERARSAGVGMEIKGKIQELTKYGPTKFLGYSSLSSSAKVIYVDEKDKIVILDKTPFYPESGGQVGDTGKIIFKGKELEVIDAFGQIGSVIVHKLKDLGGLKNKAGVKAVVDKDKRELTSKHHTTTHLLQAALREVFGKHVKQTGSYVAPDKFRFDFTHFGEVGKDDLEKVEKRVNEKIKEKIKVDVQELPIEEAKSRGALMFFDEKYGEKVRALVIGDFSIELCGGTHVTNTEDISFFKIISEGSVSAGIRRIEAKSANAAKKHLKDMADDLWKTNKHMFSQYEGLELRKGYLDSKPDTYYQFFRITTDEIAMLNSTIDKGNLFLLNRLMDDFRKKNQGLSERVKVMGKEARKVELDTFKEKAEQYEKDAIVVGDIKIVRETFRGRDMDFLREASDMIISKLSKAVTILFSVHIQKVSFVLSLTKDLVDEGFNAKEIAKEAAKVISGGGGGKTYIAEAGGKDPSKIDDVVDKIVEIIKQKKGIK